MQWIDQGHPLLWNDGGRNKKNHRTQRSKPIRPKLDTSLSSRDGGPGNWQGSSQNHFPLFPYRFWNLDPYKIASLWTIVNDPCLRM